MVTLRPYFLKKEVTCLLNLEVSAHRVAPGSNIMSSALAPMSAWYVLTACIASSVKKISLAVVFFARKVSFFLPSLSALRDVMSRNVRPTAS